MTNVSTTAKIAVIPTAAVALLMMRYLIGHTLNAMIWIAVIAGVVAVLSQAKAKRHAVPPQHDDAPTSYTLGQTTRYGLPQAQPQQQTAGRSTIADALRNY